MTKEAFQKIETGLKEALEYARADTSLTNTETAEYPEDIRRKAYIVATDVLHTLAVKDVELIQAASLIDDIIAKALSAEREKAALLAETVDLPKTERLAHMQLAVKIAARAIRRGRHLTAAEKLRNVELWLAAGEA